MNATHTHAYRDTHTHTVRTIRSGASLNGSFLFFPLLFNYLWMESLFCRSVFLFWSGKISHVNFVFALFHLWIMRLNLTEDLLMILNFLELLIILIYICVCVCVRVGRMVVSSDIFIIMNFLFNNVGFTARVWRSELSVETVSEVG